MVSAEKLPRWRGFNLLAKFSKDRRREAGTAFPEWDFRVMRDWGFDFARLPMDYRCWSKDGDPRVLDEAVLEEIDQAVEFGRKYGIHTCINFHRAPGYCCNPPAEELNVWTDQEARDICELHWRAFANRYAGLPSEQVSFNLFNEPKRPGEDGFTPQAHREVVAQLTNAIWEVDPDRLVICDGYQWGQIVCDELRDLGVAQSTRAYEPHWISHYGAHWIQGGTELPEPSWPGTSPHDENDHWDIDRLRSYWRPWKELADSGVGVHCGEGGPYHKLPHTVALAWLEDCLTVLHEYGMGWALWTFRGPFGPLDSRREGVEYEDFEDHKLDRRMLDLLQRY
jgi:endoglucanase